MTTAVIARRPARVQRSELAVPATSDDFFAKAARGAADAVFLDLEDAVAPARKAEAREKVVRALNELDWGSKTVIVRVNGLDTEWALEDITRIVACCPRLDLILVPKVGTAFDVRFVDTLLSLLERAHPRERRVGLEVLVESALGLANVEEIAAASDRLEAIVFGIGDYSINMLTFDLAIGAPRAAYAMPTGRRADGTVDRHLNDQWHFALARIANACRAYGLRPIDGPYADYGDLDAYRASAERAAVLGYEGKWAVHPSQVPIANEVFTPSDEQMEWARQLLQDLDEAVASGKGAFGRGGKLIDMAHAKLARTVLERAAAVEDVERAAVARAQADCVGRS